MDFLQQLNIKENNSGTSTGSNWINGSGETIQSSTPVNGKLIASITTTDKDSYEQVLQVAQDAFLEWRKWPCPKTR